MAFLELNVLNNSPQPILGIDLGTTNSLAAIWKDGRPTVLGEVVPSAFFFPRGELPVVGSRARKLFYILSMKWQANVARLAKRLGLELKHEVPE